MKLGSADITGIKLGSADVAKLMLGSTEVWSAAPPALSYADWLKSLNPVEFFRMADAGTTMTGEMGAITGTHGAASLAAAPIPTAAGAHQYNAAHHSTFISTAALAAAEFTTALWVKVSGAAPVNTSILNAFNDGFSRGHQLWFGHVRQPAAYMGDGNAAINVSNTGVTIGNDVPTRLVLVRGGGTTRLYANGVQAATNSSTYVPCDAGATWEVGSENGSAYFQGLVWDVAFFDYAWDAATVEEDYERGTEGVVPQMGTVLWSTDHEDGQVDWFYPGTVQDGDSVGGGEYNSGTGDSAISTEQARSGTQSLKMSINTTSGDSHGTRNFRWHEFDQYDDLFIEAWLYFPQRIGLNPANDWFNLWQWKTVKWVGSPGGDDYEYNDPLWSLDVHERGGAGSGGNNFLILVDFDAGPVGTNAPVGIDIPIGQWFKLTTRYKRHLTQGIIQVWLDDQLVFDKQNIATIRADEHATHWSVNCYADMTVPASVSIYLDDVTIALPVDSEPPTAPASVTATPATSTSVNLTWTAATDNIKVAGYEYRVNGGSWVDVGDTLGVLIGDLTASTEYTFDVRAYDDSGNFGPAASDSTTTPAPAVTFSPAVAGDDKHAQGATGSVVDFGTVIIGNTDAGEYGDDGIFRFPNVTIPQGATIHAAALVLTVYDGYGGAETVIYGDAADNSAQVSNGTDYNARTRTSASVAWTLPGSPATNRVAGEEDISPSLVSIIQEIVNRPGWESGNALSLFVTTPNAWDVRDRVRYQARGGAGTAIPARLEVTFTQ